MKYIVLLTLLLYNGISIAAEPVPLIVGGDENMDACSSLAMVTKIKADLIEGHLAVRSGPSKNHAIVDKLANGKQLWICNSANGWAGIVYEETGETNCGVTSPIFPERPYKGPCKSGWVHGSSIEVIAG